MDSQIFNVTILLRRQFILSCQFKKRRGRLPLVLQNRKNVSINPPYFELLLIRGLAISPLLKLYLVTYNVVSTLGWAYVLGLTLTHILNLDGKSDAIQGPHGTTATLVLSRFVSSLSLPKAFRFLASNTFESQLPAYLQPIYRRSTTTFSRVGPLTAFVQSFAILEVVHVLLGWVRSPLPTTAMQVSSRLFLVWGITEQFPEVCFPLVDLTVFNGF